MVVIVAAEAVAVVVVVNAFGVARFVVVVNMLLLSVTNLDVTSVVTKVITRGTVRNADASFAMSPVINGLSVQQEHRGSLLVSRLVPPGPAEVGRGMTLSFLSHRRPLLSSE